MYFLSVVCLSQTSYYSFASPTFTIPETNSMLEDANFLLGPNEHLRGSVFIKR